MKLLVLLSLIVSTAFAAPLDLDASKMTWHGSKVTGKHYGQVPFLKGSEAKVKDGKLTGGTFIADLKNFTISDLEGEWATKFLTHMKSKDFFEVEKFATATLKVTSVSGSTAKGDLTIKGKTNPVTFSIDKKKDMFVGTLKFDRTKFDMKYGSKSFFKSIGDKAIDNEVKVEFEFKTK